MPTSAGAIANLHRCLVWDDVAYRPPPLALCTARCQGVCRTRSLFALAMQIAQRDLRLVMMHGGPDGAKNWGTHISAVDQRFGQAWSTEGVILGEYGGGSNICTQNGTLVIGNMDQNLRSPGSLILTHTHMDTESFNIKMGRVCWACCFSTSAALRH